MKGYSARTTLGVRVELIRQVRRRRTAQAAINPAVTPKAKPSGSGT